MGSMAAVSINTVGKGDVLYHLPLAKIRPSVSDNSSIGVITEVTTVRVNSCGDPGCQCCYSEMKLSRV